MSAFPRASLHNPKTTGSLVLSLVFLAGIFTGAATMTLGAHTWMHRSTPFWTDAGKTISLEKWKRELNLTPAQTVEMESILDDFVKYYRSIAADGKSRILQILNDDQKRKFEELLQKQRRE